MSFCKFANGSYHSHFFLGWDKSRYLSHNSRILDQMETTKVIWEKHLLSFLLASFLEHWLTTYSLHYCFYVNKEPLPFLVVKDNQPSWNSTRSRVRFGIWLLALLHKSQGISYETWPLKYFTLKWGIFTLIESVGQSQV